MFIYTVYQKNFKRVVIQDAVQNYQWINRQATVYFCVVYYRVGGLPRNFNTVMISDYLVHDTVSVRYFL